MGLDDLKATFAEAERLAGIAHDAATRAAGIVDELGAKTDVSPIEIEAARNTLLKSEEDLSRALEAYVKAAAGFGLLVAQAAS